MPSITKCLLDERACEPAAPPLGDGLDGEDPTVVVVQVCPGTAHGHAVPHRIVSSSLPKYRLAYERAVMNEPDGLLTSAEVAAIFAVDPKTVSRWAKARKLNSIRTLGGHRSYKASEIRRVLEEGTDTRK
jgi:hypothetical protein